MRHLFSLLDFQHIAVKVVEFALDIAYLDGHHTHFHLTFDIDLVVQVGLDAVLGRLPVLANQHENGEEDRLKGHRHREKLEGKGIV